MLHAVLPFNKQNKCRNAHIQRQNNPMQQAQKQSGQITIHIPHQTDEVHLNVNY